MLNVVTNETSTLH